MNHRVIAGFVMVSLDVTIVNVALPTLAQSLGASLLELQWLVDGYALFFAAVRRQRPRLEPGTRLRCRTGSLTLGWY